MSDALKHECGVAMLRLLKPLEFYKQKYGTSFYGCLLYTSPSPRDRTRSRMPSSA